VTTDPTRGRGAARPEARTMSAPTVPIPSAASNGAHDDEPAAPGVVTIPSAVASVPVPTPVAPLEPSPAPGTVMAPAPGAHPVRGPRKARLQIRQVDPWSVMKLGFLLSLALGIVFVVAVGLLWSLLDSGGVFDSINKVVADVANDQTDFTVQSALAFRRVMGVALVLAVVQVVLITALATLAAFLYNLAAGLVGGLDVTLVEEP